MRMRTRTSAKDGIFIIKELPDKRLLLRVWHPSDVWTGYTYRISRMLHVLGLKVPVFINGIVSKDNDIMKGFLTSKGYVDRIDYTIEDNMLIFGDKSTAERCIEEHLEPIALAYQLCKY